MRRLTFGNNRWLKFIWRKSHDLRRALGASDLAAQQYRWFDSASLCQVRRAALVTWLLVREERGGHGLLATLVESLVFNAATCIAIVLPLSLVTWNVEHMANMWSDSLEQKMSRLLLGSGLLLLLFVYRGEIPFHVIVELSLHPHI